MIDINKELGLTDTKVWDGILWPYDLIEAIATFMNETTVKDGNGVKILLSSSEYLEGDRAWADLVAVNELKQRIRYLADKILFESNYDEWFDARCEIKRITDDGSMMNHCKVVCTDNQLLYVGSDNCYPNYNEEHGIWIDDTDTIKAWYEGYLSPRWGFVQPAKEDAKTQDFAATLV